MERAKKQNEPKSGRPNYAAKQLDNLASAISQPRYNRMPKVHKTGLLSGLFDN
jgi:hypothetical protein